MSQPTLTQSLDIDDYNHQLQGKTPTQIVEWVAEHAENPILTTNFRPHTAAILHLVTQVIPDIPVLWVDTGYNVDPTLEYAQRVTDLLKLNLHVRHPEETERLQQFRREGIPTPNDDDHELFTKLVKIDPFQKALDEFKPDTWITGIRSDQTDFRKSLDILSRSSQGILKVAPIYHWSKQDQLDYIAKHGLPDEKRYFDPTKVEENRECGLHTQL